MRLILQEDSVSNFIKDSAQGSGIHVFHLQVSISERFHEIIQRDHNFLHFALMDVALNIDGLLRTNLNMRDEKVGQNLLDGLAEIKTIIYWVSL